MKTFLNIPFHRPLTTVAGYAKAISAHDKGLCRYKIQIIISDLEKAQMTTYLHFPCHHSPTILA